jgi:hypothetical protein
MQPVTHGLEIRHRWRDVRFPALANTNKSRFETWRNPNKTPLATHDWWTYAEHLAVVPDCGSYNVARRSLPGNPMFYRRKYIVLHIGSRVAGAGLCHDFHETHISVWTLPDSCNAVRSVEDGVFERVLLNCVAMRCAPGLDFGLSNSRDVRSAVGVGREFSKAAHQRK